MFIRSIGPHQFQSRTEDSLDSWSTGRQRLGNNPVNCGPLDSGKDPRPPKGDVFIDAVQVIGTMRGSSQSKLVLGSDGLLWVVKLQNNPEHVRVLANEMIGTRMAEALGLTVPSCAVIHISPQLIESNATLVVHGIGGTKVKAIPGRHFGSRYAGGLMPGRVMDYLPKSFWEDVTNLHEIPGMLAFDKWTGNVDRRQAVFHRDSLQKRYRAAFIDQGHCFNAGKWSFPDAPLAGTFPGESAYTNVTGWESFEPWLHRIEEFGQERLWSLMREVPMEWYDGDSFEFERLMERLLRRRKRVRELIDHLRKSDRTPFPHWKTEGRAGRTFTNEYLHSQPLLR